MNPTQKSTSVSYSFVMRLTYPNRIGMFAKLAAVISQEGGDLGAVDIVSPDAKRMVRDVTVRAHDEAHMEAIAHALRKLKDVSVTNLSDQVFLLHLGGKISIKNKVPLTTRDTLSMAYTPGVARVCSAIAQQKDKAWSLTIKGNSIAVVSDGTAVLGLGDIGPEGAMPVMEGKAMLFKEFAGIDAYPICLNTKSTEEIIETVAHLSVGFGGINLEDISAPRCFEIERRLQERLDIPVFHDDQHGTAVVTMAALMNASRLAGRKLAGMRMVILGAGAAGTAIALILRQAGVKDIIVCDRKGILNGITRTDLNDEKKKLAAITNPRALSGKVEKALKNADVLIGVSGPGLIHAKSLKLMAKKPIIFALANPVPEIMPEEAAGKAWIIATGRSDYPNQINNVLAFPGIFRGALNVRARCVNEAMKLAAAEAIAGCIEQKDLSPEYIIPSVFNRDVAQRVAAAVSAAAMKTGVARRGLSSLSR
jgi:malate dehydrogenase (oxaloacetate-decarboxylating)